MPALYDGLSLVAIAIGLFGLPELMANAGVKDEHRPAPGKITLRSLVPTRADWKQAAAPIMRGSAIGAFFGALPGTGGVTASFMSYAVEKRVAKDPSRFGKGALEGVAAPEAANNSAVQTAFIPTLSLDAGGTWTLPRLAGDARARAMIMLAEPVSAEQAAEWGMIWKVVDDDALHDEAVAICRRLAALPGSATALAKQALLAIAAQ